jgi:acyl phosphate:glycerol-3-phosphate acyltransferase
MDVLLLSVIGFFAGSLMFSLWIGQRALRRDIRGVGDGNPGAFNLIATNKAWGALGAVLDALKGCIPVAIAKWGLMLGGAALVPIALAPILGHAFSPWLRFKGGKAVAVTFGVWTGLTVWEAPTLMGILLGLWFSIVVGSGWAVMLMMGCLLAYYLLTYPDPTYIVILLLNAALLAYKYRADLRVPLDLRPSVKGLFWRGVSNKT